MIFDADSHFLPKFAYDRMTGEYGHLRHVRAVHRTSIAEPGNHVFQHREEW